MNKNSKYNEDNKILIVDDDTISQQVLWSFVKKKWYSVDKAYNGYECIEKVIKNTRWYVAILMDINMEEMWWITATNILRWGKYKWLIIWIWWNETDREASLEAWMDYFFVKPPDFSQLFDIIENKKTSR